MEDDYCFWKQLMIRDKYIANKKVDLFELLHRTRDFVCFLEQDRILSILGLLDKADREAIMPPINPPAVDGYNSIIKNTARVLLQRDLRILSRCFWPLLPHGIRLREPN
jgi:hypothetical protein